MKRVKELEKSYQKMNDFNFKNSNSLSVTAKVDVLKF